MKTHPLDIALAEINQVIDNLKEELKDKELLRDRAFQKRNEYLLELLDDYIPKDFTETEEGAYDWHRTIKVYPRWSKSPETWERIKYNGYDLKYITEVGEVVMSDLDEIEHFLVHIL